MEHGIKYTQVYKVDCFLALHNCQAARPCITAKCWGMKILEGVQLEYENFENLFVGG